MNAVTVADQDPVAETNGILVPVVPQNKGNSPPKIKLTLL
jgi:hypothetical protein